MARDFSVLLDVPKVKSDCEFCALVEQIRGPESIEKVAELGPLPLAPLDCQGLTVC